MIISNNINRQQKKLEKFEVSMNIYDQIISWYKYKKN